MHRLDGRFVFGWMALSSFFVLNPTMLVVVSEEFNYATLIDPY